MVKMDINLCCRENYISPSVRVLDVQSEGVLCSSGEGFEINDWERDDESLDF